MEYANPIFFCYSYLDMLNIDIYKNYQLILEEVKETAHKCGRDPDGIKIMAVTKNQSISAALEAYNAGIRLFGENRVLEGATKFRAMDKIDCEVHLIGHLQRNKARESLYFDCIQSIDKFDTIKAIKKYLREKEVCEIFLEVNTSGETSKSGVDGYSELRNLLDNILNVPSFIVKGLMTIAPFTDDEKAVRKSFSSLRDMKEQLESEYATMQNLQLSMGMSGDYKCAILEGSDLIRIGSSLFGERRA